MPVLAAPRDYFGIHVVDAATGRGVPLVELKTTNHIRYYTDSAGWVAFLEPGLMDQEVYFHVASHGYEYPADGFGYRGVRLKVRPGAEAEIKLPRVNIAERLYRITGGGIYRDSVLLGKPAPLAQPVLNGLVFGQDSVLSTVYHGRVYWFWGDTAWPRYPLGNFNAPGATSRLPADGGLAPVVGVDLTYFVDEQGFARAMAPVPGDGPTWIDGLTVLRDAGGEERMHAVYAKVNQQMETQRCGLLRYNDEKEQFEPVTTWDLKAPLRPGGHPLLHREGGVDYVYFARPLPNVRVPAQVELLPELSNYACYTCLKPGCTAEAPELERDAEGFLRWAWKKDAPPLTPGKQEELLKAGQMRPSEARFRLYDTDTGTPVQVHGASVCWNAYRGRFVGIIQQMWGTSLLGETWFAEADTPLGPWRYATKIVTHKDYSFYNPQQHPFFDEDGGRRIYFQATYTTLFTNNQDPTPRYEYNQIMYGLDLADERLILPVAFYDLAPAGEPGRFGTYAQLPPQEPPPAPAFYAWDRPRAGCVAVYERALPVAAGASAESPASASAEGPAATAPRVDSAATARPEETDSGRSLPRSAPAFRLEVAGSSTSQPAGAPCPLFYALPSVTENPPATTMLLYACPVDDGAKMVYLTEESGGPTTQAAGTVPVCRVWRVGNED